MKPPTAKGFESSTRRSGTPRLPNTLERGAEAMAPRLFPAVPDAKYLCFYPMDRKRGEQVNWYTVPFAERQRMMHEHGMIGRRYADQVKQIISGSIGMDDWEWGVDLFADDPVVFKKLIYEMRFDEVSAVYALFGQFYIGVRLPVEKLEGGSMGLSGGAITSSGPTNLSGSVSMTVPQAEPDVEFTSAPDAPLLFQLRSDGYHYISGSGTVKLPSGRVYTFPPTKARPISPTVR
jgi:hypothetical protein